MEQQLCLDLLEGKEKSKQFIWNRSGERLLIKGLSDKIDKQVFLFFDSLKFQRIEVDEEETKHPDYILNDLLKKAYQLSIQTDYFKIGNYFELNNTEKSLKLYFEFRFVRNCFAEKVVAPLRSFDKIIIGCGKYLSVYDLREIGIYLQQFSSIQFVKINISRNKYSYFDRSSIIEIVKTLSKVSEVEVIQNDTIITKRNSQIQIEEIVATQLTMPELNKVQGIAVVRKLDKVIDLTSKNVNKQLLKDSAQKHTFLDTPRVLKFFGTSNQLQGVRQILERFQKISTLIMILKPKNEDAEIESKEQNDMLDVLNEVAKTLKTLRHLVVQSKHSFFHKHNEIIKIFNSKHSNFKVTYENSVSAITYSPVDKFLKFKNSSEEQPAEEDFIKIFSLYPNTIKVCVSDNIQSIQKAINVLPQFKTIRKVKFIINVFNEQLDFSPLYPKLELSRLKLFWNHDQVNINTLPTLRSLINHPSCPVIASKKFTFNSESKKAFLTIDKEDLPLLYSTALFSRFTDINKINIIKNSQFDYDFLWMVLTLPSLVTIEIDKKNPRLSLPGTDSKPMDVFDEIQAQKVQIAWIKKHLSEFIPIYLPQLMFDLYS